MKYHTCNDTRVDWCIFPEPAWSVFEAQFSQILKNGDSDGPCNSTGSPPTTGPFGCECCAQSTIVLLPEDTSCTPISQRRKMSFVCSRARQTRCRSLVRIKSSRFPSLWGCLGIFIYDMRSGGMTHQPCENADWNNRFEHARLLLSAV